MSIISRLKHGWDAFRNRDPTREWRVDTIGGETYNPDKIRINIQKERTILASLYNRIAMDVASVSIRHVRLDQNGRYKEDISGPLNDRLTYSPNLDQTPRAFFQDATLSMFDEGYVALVPVEADYDLTKTMSFSIYELRRGRIAEWFPEKVRIEAYNQKSGRVEEIIMPKKVTAIVENPFYTIMNGPNSTFQRLVSKLNMLDSLDKAASSGKLDIIIQLPYGVRNEMQQKRSEMRRKDIEMQLTGSKYGIAYLDATERITQLNRPVENNLLGQIEYLRTELLSQLGATIELLNGTASEEVQLNYNNRTIEPIVAAFSDEMKRKFLSKTAYTQGQSIMYFRDPFKLAPVSQVAELGDKLTRNEILTPNEFRAILGYKPSDDPRADELRNANIAMSKQEQSNLLNTPKTDDEPEQ